MSKSRSRNSLLSSNSKVAHNHVDHHELSSMKYQLEQPTDSIYPLNSKSNDSKPKSKPSTYPDFQPWKDHAHLDEETSKREIEKMQNPLFLNKGLFEAPQVSNEYYSARNLVQAAVFSSSENCSNVLKELSQHLANVFKTRNESINKIKADSNNFRLPPRVTLTSSKREAWLKDLADPTVPLSQVSSRLPHGIKNKILVDALCSKLVPIPRALWFTKCVLYGDSIAIRKKVHMKVTQAPFQGDETALLESQEIQWLQEWTQQVVDYLYRFSRDISNTSSAEKKQETMIKLNYVLKYIQALYIECLIDKDSFLSSILKFFKEGLLLDTHSVVQLLLHDKSDSSEKAYEASVKDLDLNYGQRLVALLAIKIFWHDIMKLDYICKELCELLLLNHYFIQKAPTFNPKQLKPSNVDNVLSQKLKSKILSQISETVKYLFKFNTNAFIMPNYWILIGRVLYKILLADSINMSKEELEHTERQLQLISYRNESLMLNMKHSKSQKEMNSNNQLYNSHRRTSSFPSGFGASSFQFDSIMLSPEQSTTLDSVEGDLFINRNSDDILRIIDYLDKQKFNEELAKLLRPNVSKVKGSQPQTDWKLNMSIVIMWCVTGYRDAGYSSENILMACGFIKHRVIQGNNSKTVAKIKSSLEGAILDILYTYAEKEELCINFQSLYVLINELYQLKIVTISAYLRKLIASGIFYLEPGAEPDLQNPSVRIQTEILKNLPVLNNKQCDNILRKWSTDEIEYVESFERGKQIATAEVIDQIKSNSVGECDLSFFDTLKIGTRYLTINWMTEEIKTLINKSAKLIHIRISTITNLYRVYSVCDNLTVFFKVIVKSVLKNEGKVVILDLDALYLISLLMVRHFKLIKTISGNDATSVGYEIFRLIIVNYKDITTRESDYFNFKGVWDFIDNSVERTNVDKVPENSKISKPSTIPQFIYSKATVESPMKLNTQDKETIKGEDQYSTLDEFGNDLEELLNRPYEFMTNEDVNDAVNRLKLNNASQYISGGESGSTRLLVILIDYYMKADHKLSSDDDSLLVKLLVNTRNSMEADDSSSFGESLGYFIQKQFDKFEKDIMEEEEVSQNKSRFMTVLKKLVANGVVDFPQLVTSINSVVDNNGVDLNLNYVLYELLIGNDQETGSLGTNQLLLLDLQRYSYGIKHESSLFEIIANENKTKIDEDGFYVSDRARGLLKKWLYSRARFLMETISTHFSNDQIAVLVSQVSDFGTNIETVDDLIGIIPKINEFNLTLFQILFKLVLVKEFDRIHDTEEKFFKLRQIIELVLSKAKFNFTMENSFFGELFNLLPLNFKTETLRILESILFDNCKFTNGDQVTVTCEYSKDDTSLDILPILSDYFKKFTVSSIDSIETSDTFFRNLSDYLSQVLNQVRATNSGQEIDFMAINRALSIFIRILIIHKDTITKYIISSDLEGVQFVTSLKSLLATEYLSNGNEKLHILLYDLLLIFRDLIMKELNLSISEERQMPNSNVNHDPNISIGDSLLDENYKVPKYEKFAPLFDLPNLESHNILRQFIGHDNNIKSAITLTQSELQKGGDFQNMNHSQFTMVKSRRDPVFLSNSGPFNLLKKPNESPPQFAIKSFEILDNTDDSINNGRINLSLFDAYTTKQNPP